MAELLTDALLDTLKLVPWLLVMHVLIEVFEYHAVSKIKLNKALRGPCAPLIGGACGILPQCGFGVVAADLYSRRSIRLGTMIAVFVATSDEAIPILLSAPTKDGAVKLAVLLGCKFVAALVAGYVLNFLLRKRELTAVSDDATVLRGCHRHELGEHTHERRRKDEPAENEEREKEPAHEEKQTHDDAHDCEHGEELAEERTHDCEHAEKHAHEAKHAKKFDFQCFVVHPLLHTLTVSGYILAVNSAMAILLYFVGEARLVAFLSASEFLQPVLAGLVGLIPNCASSVVLAQMFARGGITLGAAFAGLSVNAGLGVAVLLRKNRPATHNLYIVAGLYGYSVAVGLLLTLLPI